MDPKTILNTLKEASPFDLFLISFLLLPFVVNAWMGILNKLGLSESVLYYGIGIILIFYVLGIVLMLQGSSRAKNREIARDQIIKYLTSKNYEMMSFDRVRNNINKAYSNKFLESLIQHFPNEIRKARLKGGKPGVAQIIESNVEDEA